MVTNLVNSVFSWFGLIELYINEYGCLIIMLCLSMRELSKIIISIFSNIILARKSTLQPSGEQDVAKAECLEKESLLK